MERSTNLKSTSHNPGLTPAMADHGRPWRFDKITEAKRSTPRNCEVAKQRSREASKPRSRDTAKPRSREAALRGSDLRLCGFFWRLPFLSALALHRCLPSSFLSCFLAGGDRRPARPAAVPPGIIIRKQLIPYVQHDQSYYVFFVYS